MASFTEHDMELFKEGRAAILRTYATLDLKQETADILISIVDDIRKLKELQILFILLLLML